MADHDALHGQRAVGEPAVIALERLDDGLRGIGAGLHVVRGRRGVRVHRDGLLHGGRLARLDDRDGGRAIQVLLRAARRIEDARTSSSRPCAWARPAFFTTTVIARSSPAPTVLGKPAHDGRHLAGSAAASPGYCRTRSGNCSRSSTSGWVFSLSAQACSLYCPGAVSGRIVTVTCSVNVSPGLEQRHDLRALQVFLGAVGRRDQVVLGDRRIGVHRPDVLDGALDLDAAGPVPRSTSGY